MEILGSESPKRLVPTKSSASTAIAHSRGRSTGPTVSPDFFSESNKNVCQLLGSMDFSELELPDTVRGLMRGRFNRIADNDHRARMQHVLKVASVFGSEFSVDLLLDVLMEEEDLLAKAVSTSDIRNLKADDITASEKKRLVSDLSDLEKLGFLARLSAPTGSTEGMCFRFEQSMMRVAHDMLLFEHPFPAYHKLIASFERRNAGCLDLVFPELAQHFLRLKMLLKLSSS